MGTDDLEQTVEDTMLNKSDNKSNSDEEIEKSLSRLIEEMSSTERLALKTDLSEEDIKHLSVLETMDDELMDDFSENFKQNRVSKHRRGRKEFIQMAEAFEDALKSNEGKLSKIKDAMNPL